MISTKKLCSHSKNRVPYMRRRAYKSKRKRLEFSNIFFQNLHDFIDLFKFFFFQVDFSIKLLRLSAEFRFFSSRLVVLKFFFAISRSFFFRYSRNFNLKTPNKPMWYLFFRKTSLYLRQHVFLEFGSFDFYEIF